jgi:hypothetical protein
MKLIANFHHTPGVHCGTTAMRDLLCYIGIDTSEAMCLGLGSGLGFTYLRDPEGRSPSHLFYGRTINLEHDLCAHLSLDYEEGADDDADHAWQVAKTWVDHDIPVLLHVELSGLPYYRTRTRFPGHRVVLAGYDDARQIAFLADTNFPDLQTISYDALRAARATRLPPIPLHNEWLIIKPSKPALIADAIIRALRDNALDMVMDRAPHQGVMGMETLAEDFETWDKFADWEFCARFGYQNIDMRGTGGGFFRKMHAQFLRESETLGAIDRSVKLADQMEEIANEWSAFGAILKQIADEKNVALFAEASNAIRHLAKREEDFWGQVLDAVGR